MGKVKLSVILMSAVMSMCFITGVNAKDTSVVASASYSSQDVNRDQTVDIMDAIYLNKCLQGTKYVSNNAVLDADGNSIVSVADANCVLAGTVSNTFVNRVNGTSKSFSPFTTSTVPTTYKSKFQQYISYNYQTNTESRYTLRLQETIANASTMDLPGVIGDDSRVPDAVDGIVYLTAGSGNGTGFIVGDHVIATSAHCVYGRSTSEWLSNLKIYFPNENGVTTTTSINAVEAHIPSTYKLNSNDKYDYALITVSEDLSDHYHFNLGIPYNMYTNTDFAKYTIYSTGFSGKHPDGQLNLFPNKQMYTGEGKIVTGSNVDQNLVCFDTDITYGNSGGPVYVKETYKAGSNAAKESLTVISICSGIYSVDSPNYNMGPTMDAIMLSFFLSNPHISY